MSRFERYGFGRVLVAGLACWTVIDLHLIVVSLEVVALGTAAVFCWRLAGRELRRLGSEQRRVWKP